MPIHRHGSLIHADKILREVKKLWPKEWDGWLRNLSNGREQGYHLSVSMWDEKRDERCGAACIFSEARSSDSALVVVGDEFDFSLTSGSQAPEKLWESDEHRKYFGDLDGLKTYEWVKEKHEGRGDKAAAKWIIKRLREIMQENLKKQRAERKAS